MVKRIRTLLTLFLLVMGTGMSWADFKELKLDFTLSWANVISQDNDSYVVGLTGDVPTLVGTEPASYLACISGMKYHGNQYGIYAGKIKVPVVSGKYEIGLGITDYGGDIYVYAGEKQIAFVDSKSNQGEKFFVDKTKIATGQFNVESDCELTITTTQDKLGNVYYPYFSIKRVGDYEQQSSKVKVTYHNTDGNVIGTDVVNEGSALTFKYNESNVTVPAGCKFRGWFKSTDEYALKVKESTVVNEDLDLYAKATLIEEPTMTSSYNFDFRKKGWYPEDHEVIEISNTGAYYHDPDHGWAFHGGDEIELKVAGNALITLDRCSNGAITNFRLFSGTKEIGSATAPVDVEGEPAVFKYNGGATTLTLKVETGNETYLHGISIDHIYTIPFEPFKIDFRSEPYTVVVPENGKLPACVKSIGGEWHDNQHGYYNGVGATISVDRPVKFYIGACRHSKTNATVSVNGDAPIEIPTISENCDNSTSYNVFATYIYKGTESATLKFTLGDYCPYIIAEEWSGLEYDEDTKTFNVEAGNVNLLKEAIKQANAMGGNVTIYLPNGTYDLESDINTEIRANNIAIVGESRDGVIIMNSPAKEGLDKTATLKNTSTGLYLQDVTIQCYAPYNKNTQAERGVALWDQGTKTICKNVYLKGRQDVYYSNGANGMKAYFEGGKIEGTVDFVCGSGNILFNSVNLIVTTSDNKSEGGVIAAPSTYGSETGHVFVNCLVSGAPSQSDTYRFARGWHAHGQAAPAAIFVGTITNILPNASSCWGENMGAVTNRRFAVYEIDGTVIDSDNNAADITKASLVSFAGEWDPAAIISKHCPIKTNGAGWASYTAFTDVRITDGAKAYVAKKINAHSVTLTSIDEIPAGTPVFIYGDKKSAYHVVGTIAGSAPNVNYLKPVLFDKLVTSSANAFVIGTKDGKPGLYRISSKFRIPAGKCYLDASGASLALAKDQLELVFVEEEATGIDNVVAGSDDNATRYNLAGQKVGNDYKGIVIKGGKKYLAK